MVRIWEIMVAMIDRCDFEGIVESAKSYQNKHVKSVLLIVDY